MEILDKSNIQYLVVHCSDTDVNFSAADIHKLHLSFGWSGIGYHKIIEKDGMIVDGRPLYWMGAHVKGFNNVSLGVCLIGRYNFTADQFSSLRKLLLDWSSEFPDAVIIGHRDITQTKKTCPNFNVKSWCEKNLN